MLTKENQNLGTKVICYDGKMDINVVLDWLSDIEKFFDYENTLDNRKVKIAITKLKGHASLWWEHLQTNRQRRRKEKIITWLKMVNKVNNKFLLVDYQVSLFRKMQNLK